MVAPQSTSFHLRASDLLKIGGLLLLGGILAGNASGPPNSDGPGKPGCAGCLGMLLILGLIGMALERMGCIATDDVLRNKVQVIITDVRVQPNKNLAWVAFTIRNQSGWPVSVGVRMEIYQVTKSYAAASNMAEALNVPTGCDSAEQRIAFDLEDLKRDGITDPTDSEQCSIRQKVLWICEAGKEGEHRCQ